MKLFYAFLITVCTSTLIIAQHEICHLDAHANCPGCIPKSQENNATPPALIRSQFGTEVFANQVPIVHYDGALQAYPLELRVQSTKEIESILINHYDYASRSYIVSVLQDNGENLDESPNDNTYTSEALIVQSRDIRNLDSIFRYNLISGIVTINYSDGNTEDFRVKLDGFTIDGDVIKLDTTDLEISNTGSFYYSKHAVNYVMPQEYSRSQINFPVEDIKDEFKNIWTDFKDAYLVFTTYSESNGGSISFKTFVNPLGGKYIVNLTNAGMLSGYPLNHEINHFWVYTSRFDYFPSHLRYIERPQSGFGYDCYNGVMTNIREEGGVVKYSIDEDPNKPHEYYFSDFELNLMGVLPVDSVDFPIKYVKQMPGTSIECDSRLKILQNGVIDSLSKQEYIDYVSGINDLPNVSDGLELKFIFITEERVSKEEHALLERMVLNYADLFKESTSNLVELDTEIYGLTTSVSSSFNVDHSYTIFPNPSSGLINIEAESEVILDAFLMDMVGKTVKTIQLNNGPNQLNINDVPAGVYFIRIIDTKGNHQTEKIVKL